MTTQNCDKSELTTEENKAEKLKAKENIREFATKPFRVTCRKDITSILKRITNINDMIPSEPILHLQSTESTPYALQQILYPKEIRETITLKVCFFPIISREIVLKSPLKYFIINV